MSIPFIKNPKTSVKCLVLKTNHITCKMIINDIEGSFLIDSGASNSCINIESSEGFKLVKYKKSYSASGAGNGKFDVSKSKKAQISHQGKNVVKLNFLLIDMTSINKALNESDNINVDGILGADFLIEKNASIDYNTMTLSF
tara:strand:+ start:1817 stop:2242 length:426 start_codon:yes stop_codon:yes gene_type:complete